MTSKTIYTAPCAEPIVLQTEQSFTQSFDSTDRTEKLGREEEELDL